MKHQFSEHAREPSDDNMSDDEPVRELPLRNEQDDTFSLQNAAFIPPPQPLLPKTVVVMEQLRTGSATPLM